ncbi:MAG: hypothetical protein IJQ56_11840 [Synergistaceae bacterium]|nr:hypothetical protein [Synergistaceae bacterium]MBR0205044.1 hypothetical protein [Synergistaceae bacterium]
MSDKIVNLNDRSISEKRVANETPLTQKADEAGRVVATPVHNASQARKLAKGKVKSSGMSSGIEAEAVTIGLPYLKARDTITIENIGRKFSGNWRITKVIHEISNGGYTCKLSLSRNDHGSSGNNKKTSGAAPKGSAGMSKNNAKSAGEVKAGQGNSSSSQAKAEKPSSYKYDLNTGKRVQ